MIEVDKLNRQTLIKVGFKRSLKQQTMNNKAKLVPTKIVYKTPGIVKEISGNFGGEIVMWK